MLIFLVHPCDDSMRNLLSPRRELLDEGQRLGFGVPNEHCHGRFFLHEEKGRGPVFATVSLVTMKGASIGLGASQQILNINVLFRVLAMCPVSPVLPLAMCLVGLTFDAKTLLLFHQGRLMVAP